MTRARASHGTMRQVWSEKKRAPRFLAGLLDDPLLWTCLDSAHVGRLGAFLTLGDIESHAVTFGKGLESITLNRRKMNKHVRSVILLDKTKTFCVVKPFHSTFSHFFSMLPIGTFLLCKHTHPENKKTHNPRGLCA